MMSAFMFPKYLATNKIQYIEEGKEIPKEDRGTWYQERPVVGPNRSERETKLIHSNLQRSKCLCIIIRSCYKYKC